VNEERKKLKAAEHIHCEWRAYSKSARTNICTVYRQQDGHTI